MPKKPMPKTAPKPDLTYVPEGELPKLFLVRVAGGTSWWTKEGGTSDSLLNAGTFTQAAADELATRTGDQVIPLERAAQEACRSANPVVLAAVAALGGR